MAAKKHSSHTPICLEKYLLIVDKVTGDVVYHEEGASVQ